MQKYTVNLSPKAFKQLKELPANIQMLVGKAITAFENMGPVPRHWDVKKIEYNSYRIRLNYRYRMKYIVDSDFLLIDIFI